MEFIIFTWNVEGVRRNIFNLKNLLNDHRPHLIFLSETQIFACDSSHVMSHLEGDYCCYPNSLDVHDPDFPLKVSKAIGGTMALWRQDLDPFISNHPVTSAAFLPLILQPPGCITSIHIGVYLPTHGREQEFFHELTELSHTMEVLQTEYPDSPIYLRGDFNVNKNHMK